MDQDYHQRLNHLITSEQTGNAFPAAEEIEQQVLCACIINPGDNMPMCYDDLTDGDFYLLKHKTIWSAMRDMWFKKQPIELSTILNTLIEKKESEQAGGAVYLSQLVDNVPASVDITHHVNILQGKRALREAIEACNAIVKRAMSNDPALETIDQFVKMATDIRIDESNSDIKSMEQMTDSAVQMIDKVQAGDGRLLGVDTGFVRFNKLTNGFQNSDLILLAARPSMGKTSLMMNMAKRQAKKGIVSAVFSLEQPNEQLYFRMLADEAEIDSQRLYRGGFTPEEMDKITDAQARLYEMPIHIDDKGSLTVEEICARARKYKAKWGVQIIYLDHLQLTDTKRDFRGNRNNQLGYTTQRLKTLAKDLRLPVVCLSQLNRNLENRPNPNKRPRLSDLRDSGNLEQDADVIGFVYRPEVYNDNESMKWPGYTDVFLGKNRNGPIGSMDLSWQAAYTRFYEVDPRYAGGYGNPI